MMSTGKPTPPCSLTEMLSDIDASSDAIYWGPGAYTEVELQDQSPYCGETVKARADEKVIKGEWVSVKVQRKAKNGRAYYPTAWVKRDVYEEWLEKKGGTEKLGAEDV